MQPIFQRLCHAYAHKQQFKHEDAASFTQTHHFLRFAIREFYKECQEYLTAAGFPDENFFIDLVDEGRLTARDLEERAFIYYDDFISSIKTKEDLINYAEEKLAKYPQNEAINISIEAHKRELKTFTDPFVDKLRFHLAHLV